MKAVRILAAALLSLLLLSTAPAGAQSANASPCAPGGPNRPTNPGGQYPPSDCGVGADRSQVGPGGQVRLTGNCPAGTESVTFRLIPGNADLGRTTPDGSGNYSTTVTIPASTRSGDYQIEATCTGVLGNNVVRRVAITVVRPGAASLPRTGAASVLPMGGAGLALLAVGGAAVLVARRRRTADAA